MTEGQTRNRAVRKVLWVEMALNLVVAAAKGILGLVTGSLAVATDGLHSLLDASSNVIGLFVLRRAAAPPDERHPYGHDKLELVAATAIGVAIALVGARFASSALEALVLGSEAPSTSVLGFAILIGTWMVNIFVAVYEGYQARKLKSPYLAADAAHTASDVLVTALVIVSYAAAHYGVHWADPIGAIVVALVIARVAWQVIRSNLVGLIDSAIVDPKRIEAIVRNIEGVHACHRIRSRGTATTVHVDFHLLVSGDPSLRDAHRLSHAAEEAVKREWPQVTDVTIHVEPEDSEFESL